MFALVILWDWSVRLGRRRRFIIDLMDFRSNAFMVFGMDNASVGVDGGKDVGDVVGNHHCCSSSETVVRASKELECRQTLSSDESCCIVCLRRLIARG